MSEIAFTFILVTKRQHCVVKIYDGYDKRVFVFTKKVSPYFVHTSNDVMWLWRVARPGLLLKTENFVSIRISE